MEIKAIGPNVVCEGSRKTAELVSSAVCFIIIRYSVTDTISYGDLKQYPIGYKNTGTIKKPRNQQSSGRRNKRWKWFERFGIKRDAMFPLEWKKRVLLIENSTLFRRIKSRLSIVEGFLWRFNYADYAVRCVRTIGRTYSAPYENKRI